MMSLILLQWGAYKNFLIHPHSVVAYFMQLICVYDHILEIWNP